jgi:hypothetical protein
MGTMPPPTASAQPPGPQQPDPNVPQSPVLDKALEQTMQALGKVYMECHKLSPDSPLCDAVISVQKAVAEIASNAGMPTDPSLMADPNAPVESPAEEAQDPMGPGGPEGPLDAGDPMDAGPPPASIADAAGETQTMMQDAAKRRQAKG